MKHNLYITFLGCFLIFGAALQAQEEELIDNVPHSGGWVTLGIGTTNFGPAFYTNVTYAYKENLFSVRYLKADEFRFNVEGHYDDPALSRKEFGILYGRSYRRDYLVLSLSAGFGYVKGIDRGRYIEFEKYDGVNISTFGIPFEAQFRFELGVVGIGGSWYGNLNSRKSISGAILEISIGVF